MNTPHDLSRWAHSHDFASSNRHAEAGTRRVLWITLLMMLIEISAGWWFNSMALLADGWHMSSHALAIGLSALAYASARRYARDPRFAFGSWKVEVLGGFASAVLLLAIVVLMAVGSLERLVTPQPIQYHEAMVVAALGLLVNLLCAGILGKAHHHGPGLAHGHPHDHEHGHAHDDASSPDLNLRSAYVHVVADAATSVLALVALFGGARFGWAWLDPVMGLVGALLVGLWARGLIVQTGRVLLDGEMHHPVVAEIREVVESDAHPGHTRIVDLHVWRVGRAVYSCALTVVTHDPALTPDVVRARLAVHEEVVHSTIEVHHCPG